MADWRDIGIDNFRAAALLVETKQYRSAVSRFYYAVFSIVTQELIERGATNDFRDGRTTPEHNQLATLIDRHFTHFGEERRSNFIRIVARVYGDRLNADYSRNRIDRDTAKLTHQKAESVFRYMGVNHERR